MDCPLVRRVRPCHRQAAAVLPELRAGTLELYRYAASRLVNHFGKDRPLQDITLKDAEVFIAQQRCIAKGRKQGQDLSEWSREQIKHYCKLIFEAAVQWELLRKSPFEKIGFKKSATRRWHRISVQEYHALLEAAPTLRWTVFYALAYTSGGG